ncbi:MAG: hypothetical protein P4L51_23840 [Puia sp.]|nr:hypothetical protein [Puia sp.]
MNSQSFEEVAYQAMLTGDGKARELFHATYFDELSGFAGSIVTNEDVGNRIADKVLGTFYKKMEHFQTIQKARNYLFLATRTAAMEALAK